MESDNDSIRRKINNSNEYTSKKSKSNKNKNKIKIRKFIKNNLYLNDFNYYIKNTIKMNKFREEKYNDKKKKNKNISTNKYITKNVIFQ
jgi:hypothetical protein